MKTLAVTRPIGYGGDTASLIRKHGWSPLIFHTVELKPRPASLVLRELKEIVSSGSPDWVVVMSPRGARLLLAPFEGKDAVAKSILGGSCFLAVGPKTEESLRQQSAKDVQTPEDYSSKGVADFLSRKKIRGKRVILARSNEASNLLEKQLSVEGALTSTIKLYDSRIPTNHQSTSKFLAKLASGSITATLFTSALSAANLFKMTGRDLDESDLRRLLEKGVVGAIGPTTLEQLKTLGLGSALMPKRFLIEDAVVCLIDAAEKNASIPS